MKITPGFAEDERDIIARLYWQAFGPKLGRVMQPEAKALRFVARVLRPDHAITARGNDGRLLGVVGFKTRDGALVGGALRDMQAVYGRLGGLWRGALLAFLERDTENLRFLMDGLFVAEGARGQGVGTALLSAIYDEGKRRGYDAIRLDVIDSNPRAKALYRREGFRQVATHKLGLLRLLFGFRSSATMVRTL